VKAIPLTLLAIAVVLPGCRDPQHHGDTLSPAELSMDDVAALPQQKVEERLSNSHGAVYYGYAARLFNEGRKEEAVLWFYVGQIRFRFDLAAKPDADSSGGPALLASLNSSIGARINDWAAKDTALWLRQINRALEWDATRPNGVTSKATFKKEYEEVRSGLTRMREEIVTRGHDSAESSSTTQLAFHELHGVPVIRISGPIDRIGAESVLRLLRKMGESRPRVAVFVIAAPDGEISAVLDLIEGISATKRRVYGLVEQAFGGAVFLAASLDELYFSRLGVCGSAAVVLDGKQNWRLITKLKDLASAHGRDPEVFSAMIDAEMELVRGPKVWKEKRQILTVTAREAMELGISDGYCDSTEDLVKRITEKKGEPLLSPHGQ
jgi:hypothetical protein